MNKYLITLLLIGASCDYFGVLEVSLYKYIPFVTIFFTIAYYKNDLLFRKNMIWFYGLLYISAISCYINRGQTISDTLMTREYFNFYCLTLFYVFLSLKPSLKDVGHVVLSLYVIFIAVYILQYIYYPKEIVTLIVNNEREHRFRIMGQTINIVGYFYCVCSYMATRKLMYLMLSFMGILIVFLMGFRMMLAAILLITAVAYFRMKKKSIKNILSTVVVVGVFTYLLSLIPAVTDSVERMIEANDSQTYLNDDYIRWMQFAYFTNDHFNSLIEWITGSGIPGRFSSYGNMMALDKDHFEATAIYGWVDWGLIGLSWVAGPFTVIALVLMWFKCIKISWFEEVKYQYVAYSLIFLLIISVNNIEIYRIGSFGIHALLLYLVNNLYQIKLNHEG